MPGLGRTAGPASSNAFWLSFIVIPGRVQRERGMTSAIIKAGRKPRSAVAKAVGGAFPLRHIVGDHARGFHRGLAELGIAGNLALYPLTFGVQEVAQAFEF